MQETEVQSLDWEDPLEKEWQLTPVFLLGKSYRQRSLVGYSPLRYRVRRDLATKKQQPKSKLMTEITQAEEDLPFILKGTGICWIIVFEMMK